MGDRARQLEGAREFIQGLCEEYCDEAAALWEYRKKAVTAPDYDLNDLLELDKRLEAQIDALGVTGETGWKICRQSFEDDAGKCFVASVLAFNGADEARAYLVVEKAAASPALKESVVSALHWLEYEKAEPHIRKMLESESTACQYMGIAASMLHRRDPQHYLDNAIVSSDPTLKARALLGVGEAGRKVSTLLTGYLHDNFNDQDPLVCFSAAWSAALMGDTKSLEVLKREVNPDSAFREKAINIAMRRLDHESALVWQKQLAKFEDTLRLAVLGAGIIGDPALVPWLLEQMRIPELARVAGEAFTMITGIDIAKTGMEGRCIAGFSRGPSDEPGDWRVGPDPDESLAWPDRELIAEWWKRNKSKFRNGTRLLLGKPITGENIADVLNTGSQRQRAAAALEQAMFEPGKPLYEISAPAWRQLKGKNDPLPVLARPGCSSKELVITAVNCVTPVGLDAEMTAASVRAGISRLILYDDYPDSEGNSIKAARINGIWDSEQEAVERLRKIAGVCLEDMLEKYFEGVRKRPIQGYILLGAAPEARPGADFGEEFIYTQRSILANYADEPLIELVSGGNASFHRSIERAGQIIETNPESLCILGGIDSLIDHRALNWFEGDNRLKSDSCGRHQGLSASEAVSFMIVEGRDRAIRDNRPILARIAALGLKDEPQPRASGREGCDTGLSEACLAALESFSKRELRTIFGDLNGEASRAREWSIASLRCFRGENNLDLWSPAEFYGDIGAASGGVLAGIATQGFARNWIESPVLIFCSDDHGQCGAVILEKEGGSS